jgi:hypothetical protein
LRLTAAAKPPLAPLPAGCNRSFAELWRLKVHFRAPPDVRGSGKERGHGTELKFCPKCGKDLRPGKHHVGCSAGKSAPRQAAKRQRQVRAGPPAPCLAPYRPSAAVPSALACAPRPPSPALTLHPCHPLPGTLPIPPSAANVDYDGEPGSGCDRSHHCRHH